MNKETEEAWIEFFWAAFDDETLTSEQTKIIFGKLVQVMDFREK